MNKLKHVKYITIALLFCLGFLVGYYLSSYTQQYELLDYNGVVLIVDKHECKLIWIKDHVLTQIENKMAAPIKELYYSYHAYDRGKPYMIGQSLVPVDDTYPFVIPAHYNMRYYDKESKGIMSVTFYNPKNNQAYGIEINPKKKECSFIEIVGNEDWKKSCYHNSSDVHN